MALNLARKNTHVWVDDWELNVGDSIILRIQQAIQEASALIIILSKASVESDWCNKELSAGLIRELEEKRVIVLPILIEDCDIPLFLRDKKYADFRGSFNEGLSKVFESIAKVTSNVLGRTENPKWHIDWALDWGYIKNNFYLRLTLIEQAINQPYSVLSEVVIHANEIMTKRYKQYEEVGLDFAGRHVLLTILNEAKDLADLQILIDNNLEKTTILEMHDPGTGINLHVIIRCRRLGEDTGKDILLHIGEQISSTIKNLRATSRKLTPEEMVKMNVLLRQI